MLVSLITAFKNKKQRIKYQACYQVIQFTLGLPWLLFVLIWATLTDTPIIPAFGFAYFMPSDLKPIRMWSLIAPAQPSPTDKVSDGHLY
jgi:hypothetical protein